MCLKSKRTLKEEIQKLKNQLWDTEQDLDQATKGLKRRSETLKFRIAENKRLHGELNRQGDRIVELTKELAELKAWRAQFDHRNRGRDAKGKFTK